MAQDDWGATMSAPGETGNGMAVVGSNMDPSGRVPKL
jgi:hypothetical protein